MHYVSWDPNRCCSLYCSYLIWWSVLLHYHPMCKGTMLSRSICRLCKHDMMFRLEGHESAWGSDITVSWLSMICFHCKTVTQKKHVRPLYKQKHMSKQLRVTKGAVFPLPTYVNTSLVCQDFMHPEWKYADTNPNCRNNQDFFLGNKT